MGEVVDDIGELSYYRLLEASERGRWDFADLPWDSRNVDKITPCLLRNTQVAAFGELTTFSATESFMKLFRDDVDFTHWLAVWFYEETKHPTAWIKYLAINGVATDKNFIYQGREINPMTDSKVEMLIFNIMSEITANMAYQTLGKTTEEPLFMEIARNLARDEMRHSIGFEHYCRQTIENSDDPALEKVRALRALWFTMQPDRDAQHPVFMSIRRLEEVDHRTLEDKVSGAILMRMSRLLDVTLSEPEQIYDVYKRARKEYRGSRAGQEVVAALN